MRFEFVMRESGDNYDTLVKQVPKVSGRVVLVSLVLFYNLHSVSFRIGITKISVNVLICSVSFRIEITKNANQSNKLFCSPFSISC